MFRITSPIRFFAARTTVAVDVDTLSAPDVTPRDPAGAFEVRETENCRTAIRPRRRAPKTRWLDSPGMQHTLERDAARVNAAPWLY
jgi:hypothetical protein